MNNKRNNKLYAKYLFFFLFIIITKNIYSQPNINPQLLVLLKRVTYEFKDGNYQAALELLNNVIERELVNDITTEAEIYRVIGHCLYYTGQYNEALTNILHSIDLNSNDALAFEILSNIYNDYMGRYSDALQAINRAIELDNHYITFFSNRALIYLNLNDYEKSLNDVNYVLNIDSKFHHSLQIKATILLKKNNYNEALLYINKAVSINSSIHQYFEIRGLINYRLEREDEAFIDFTRAIELGSQDAEVFKYRAWLYTDMGKNDEALKDLNAALRLSPNNPELYVSRASVHLNMKNMAEGSADLIEFFRLLDKEENMTNYRELQELRKELLENMGMEKDMLIKILELFRN